MMYDGNGKWRHGRHSRRISYGNAGKRGLVETPLLQCARGEWEAATLYDVP